MSKSWIITVAVTLLVVLAGYFYTRDIGPIDDSDLDLPEQQASAISNGYVSLVAIDYSALKQDRETLKQLFGKTEDWTPELVAKVSQACAETIPAIEASLEAANFAPVDPGDLANHATPLMSAERILLAQFWHCLYEKRFDDATDSAWLIGKYSERMLEISSSIVHYIVANRGRAGMYDGLRQLISHPELAERHLEKIKAVLPDPDALDRPLGQALKGEYQFIKKTIFGKISAESSGASFVMKENTTLKNLADYFRGYVENIPVVASQRDMSFADSFLRDPSTFDAILSGNPIGSSVASIATPELQGLLDEHSGRKAQRRLLEIALALRSYEMQHLSLPNSLEALVPAQLNASPVDPFSGDPFVYDKEKRRVHSVGMNLADDQGHDVQDIVISLSST